MTNKKGFTLTEVLLAVMVVGLIGVALASLTTAASREAGTGRSKIMLRNNLSLFLRTLRNDINAATYINMSGNTAGPAEGVLFELCDNRSALDGSAITNPGHNMGCVTYTFTKGTKETRVFPRGATRGGVIRRNGQVVLNNVKFVDNHKGYSSPYFKRVGNTHVASAIDMTVIVELDSIQPVNDIVQETFLLPNGL